MPEFVSRAGFKLEHALQQFEIDVTGSTCADLGCNAGGFVDCLLQHGAAKVFAIDTGYGALDWKLRIDPRVIVMERTNAMHARLPEKVARVTIDVAWTKQKHILPAARLMIADNGIVITLIKPHYEADASLLRKGILPAEAVERVVSLAVNDAQAAGFEVVRTVQSPITGTKGNIEVLAYLRPVI